MITGYDDHDTPHMGSRALDRRLEHCSLAERLKLLE
jgi:hypothetical protein